MHDCAEWSDHITDTIVLLLGLQSFFGYLQDG